MSAAGDTGGKSDKGGKGGKAAKAKRGACDGGVVVSKKDPDAKTVEQNMLATQAGAPHVFSHRTMRE